MMKQHDLLIKGATIRTCDKTGRVVEALAIKGGTIAAAGPLGEVAVNQGPDTKVLDLTGRTITPGFFDAHPHIDRQGLKHLGGVPLVCHSIAEILDVVRQSVARTPKGEWVVLMPMATDVDQFIDNPSQLKEGRFPTRADLDAVSPDHPVFIRAPWGWWGRPPFVSIANTRAMQLAGVTRDSPNLHNLEISRDEKGDPDGIFLDRNFAPILEYTYFNCVPRFTYEDRVIGVRRGVAEFSSFGTTATYEGHGVTPAILKAYQDVHSSGDLSVRMQIPLSLPSAAFDSRKIGDLLHHWAPQLRDRGYGDDMLRIEGACVDVGDPNVAQIIGRSYPYEQWAGHFYQSLPHEQFIELGVLSAKLRIRLNCLICYDLERVLRAYEEIDKQVRIRDLRWVMIHLVEATADQLRRIKELGVVVTVVPSFMYTAADRFDLDKLGSRGVPVDAMLDAGIRTVFSTDNAPSSMLFAMWQSVSRWDSLSQSKIGETSLTRDQALRLSSEAGHYISWNENARGALEAGKDADFVVLDGDPITCPEDEIKDIPVVSTYVGGKEVYANPQFAKKPS
jgi:predicted amidohydrolase YtcJ